MVLTAFRCFCPPIGILSRIPWKNMFPGKLSHMIRSFYCYDSPCWDEQKPKSSWKSHVHVHCVNTECVCFSMHMYIYIYDIWYDMIYDMIWYDMIYYIYIYCICAWGLVVFPSLFVSFEYYPEIGDKLAMNHVSVGVCSATQLTSSASSFSPWTNCYLEVYPLLN